MLSVANGESVLAASAPCHADPPCSSGDDRTRHNDIARRAIPEMTDVEPDDARIRNDGIDEGEAVGVPDLDDVSLPHCTRSPVSRTLYERLHAERGRARLAGEVAGSGLGILVEAKSVHYDLVRLQYQ